MRVVGTAGHVDHGKSTLIEALTGTHPDRLKEEKERQMTIDLGFAFLSLPNGEEVGIVDVPGHRDFIENMLAGIGGIDAALFVVAADEGVMPQTREHLAILDLLQIRGGVVALTKVDLVRDPEWLDLVEADLQDELNGTVLEDAPVIRVSSRSGEGTKDLLEAIEWTLADRPRRPDLGRPRLPVDRVFSVAGFGTVVTGTLTDGSFRVGEEVVVLPNGNRGRIRGLQSHNRKEEIATPGTRTAINLSGIDVEEIKRGNVIVYPKQYRTTRLLDLQFKQLPDVSQPIKHNMDVKFFLGASEVMARIRLLGTSTLAPGDDGWIQLELRNQVVALRGDRYIIRRPSPAETLGGGVVVDPHPKGRHKRFEGEVLTRMEALTGDKPDEIFQQALLRIGPAPAKKVLERSALSTSAGEEALEILIKEGEVIVLEPGDVSPQEDILIVNKSTYEDMDLRFRQETANYHHQHPLRLGIPREELKSRLSLPTRVFNAFLDDLLNRNAFAGSGAIVWLSDHKIQFTQEQKRAVDTLLARFAESPYSPPTIKESQDFLGINVYSALVDLETLVPVSEDVVFRKADYDRLIQETEQLLKERGMIKVAGFRDYFNTSRKYALAFLEHLDSIGVTVREGDVRRLKH